MGEKKKVIRGRVEGGVIASGRREEERGREY